MKVLVACEWSGVVRDAFIRHGHEAYSCDLLPTVTLDNTSHFMADCKEIIASQYWDLVIMHPPCDYLCVAGNMWYAHGTTGYPMRVQAVNWTKHLWYETRKYADRVVMENPIGVLSTVICEPHQWIHPHMFGEPEQKKTGLWLWNVPPLIPTNQLEVPPRGTKEHDKFLRVKNGTNSRGGKMRKRDRSKTTYGVADAMASQWGTLPVIENNQR